MDVNKFGGMNSINLDCPIAVNFCKQNNSVTVVLCVKFQYDHNDMDFMDEQDFLNLSLIWVSEEYFIFPVMH